MTAWQPSEAGAAIIDAAGRFAVADINGTIGAVGEHLQRIADQIPIPVPLDTMAKRLIDGDAALIVFEDADGIAAVAVACPGPFLFLDKQFLIALVDVRGTVPDSEAFPTLLEGWAKCASCAGVAIVAMGEMPCPAGYDLETFDGRSMMTRHFTIN